MTSKCPECGETIHLEVDFSPWCSKCEWNVSPSELPPGTSYWERRFEEFSRRAGSELLKDMLVEKDPASAHARQNLSDILANVISAIIFLIAFALFGGGLYLGLTHWREHSVAVIAVLMILLAAIVRPRILKMPRSVQPLSAFPALNSLVDDVADRLNIPRIRNVVITDDFNAFVFQAGIRREPCLGIGLPLWFVLSPQEQVSLIAHELSHLHNGDPARRFFPSSALYALRIWRKMMNTDWEEVPFWTLIGGIPFILLGRAIQAVEFALRLLMYRSQQRAEFLADFREATVAGTESAVSALYKLGYGQYLKRACDKAYYGGDNVGKSLLTTFRTVVDHLPQSEHERLRRQMTREYARVDTTHPPTRDRIAFLTRFPAPASLVFPQEQHAAILRELSPLAERMGGRIMNAYDYE
ncbi:M48 family metallopeptidase [Aestuariivirga sp.]|uniref:M48 family metallopeptidase n=1 Tax=Aestuariivirga sp. TaxID=2650926 RepID=UPI003BAB4B28